MSRAEQQEAWTLRLSLWDASPERWQLVELPAAMTLAALHALIQHLFDWPNMALYRFECGPVVYDVLSHETLWMGRDDALDDVCRVSLDVAFARGSLERIDYLYDPRGETQRVVVRLRQRRPYARDEVRGIALGEGNSPQLFAEEGLPSWREWEQRSLMGAGFEPALAWMGAGLTAQEVAHGTEARAATPLPSRARVEASPRALPEHLSVEELSSAVRAVGAMPETLEALTARVLEVARQSGKVHNLYLRQLVIDALRHELPEPPAREPAEEAPLPVTSPALEGEEEGRPTEVAVGAPQDEPDEEEAEPASEEVAPWWEEAVSWEVMAHPTVARVLARLPVSVLDELCVRHEVDLGGQRAAREQALREVWLEVSEALERFEACGEEGAEVAARAMASLREGEEPMAPMRTLCGEGEQAEVYSEVCRRMFLEGFLWLGRREGEVWGGVPVEMRQIVMLTRG